MKDESQPAGVTLEFRPDSLGLQENRLDLSISTETIGE